jgi:hypothetical protein
VVTADQRGQTDQRQPHDGKRADRTMVCMFPKFAMREFTVKLFVHRALALFPFAAHLVAPSAQGLAALAVLSAETMTAAEVARLGVFAGRSTRLFVHFLFIDGKFLADTYV